MTRTAILSAAIVLFSVQVVAAYTPNHPEVKRMVDKGVEFLQSTTNQQSHEGGTHAISIIVGYTAYKVHHDANHPLVQKGVGAALNFIQEQSRTRNLEDKFCYVSAFAIFLLVDVDKDRYRSAINQIAQLYFSVQKPHGGFGYPSGLEGDTSMIQYAILAFWTLDKQGFEVPQATMERVVLFLSQYQDPSGTWNYKNPPRGGRGAVLDSRWQQQVLEVS